VEVDSTTLSDLEVFEARDGTRGLFDLIDRTTTRMGSLALRRRFERSSSDIDAIRGTQAAVRFLMARPDLVEFDGNLIEGVTQYLRSRIVGLKGSSGISEYRDHAWMRVRYRDPLKEIASGVATTAALFRRVAALCETLEQSAPPAVVAQMARRLAATSEAVLRIHAQSRTILGADRALRSVHRGEIENALVLMGELDALNAMAATTNALGWAMPELVESESFMLDADGIHHPFVSNPVTNPAFLTGGEPMVFLTGPNMGGKTTYLRSVALVVLLAQVGMGVPARRVRLAPVNVLFTSLNPSDNLRAGISYFFAEILRVKEAATILAQGRRALIIFDEVFKGTNVRDALDASAEVILGFARARRSGCIFSSHLAELVGVLGASPAIRFACFDGDILDGAPTFSYELRPGVSDRRFGLLLLRQAQVPELISRIGADAA
jgi:DNA mismatch repair ATPase MutS